MSHYSPKIIESPKNPEIKELTALMKKSSKRREEGLFVAEGKRLVRDILKRRKNLVHKIFISRDADLSGVDLKGDFPVFAMPGELFNRISDTKTPQGIMAVVRRPGYSEVEGESPLILVLEDIRDPGNLGTMFRTMEACGGSKIVLLGNCTDPFSPKCVRSSMGSVVHVPFEEYQDSEELNKDLTNKGIQVFIADLGGEDYRKKDYASPCAILVGNEASGVSHRAREIFKDRITIPMDGGVESLNAAMSAGILLFEAKRQRDL